MKIISLPCILRRNPIVRGLAPPPVLRLLAQGFARGLHVAQACFGRPTLIFVKAFRRHVAILRGKNDDFQGEK